ncbi:MAG TPA: peptidoglycan-binding domain-containing protein [Gammaproteobacteria bacterium]|nr:peptidoglycan-binding domain-containing protein [Gammaproteobacteria bacterium]
MRTTHADIDAVIVLATGVVSAAELQSRLRDLGYYDGPPEAEPWPKTIDALRRFQRDNGLPITGFADAATLIALREAYCY